MRELSVSMIVVVVAAILLVVVHLWLQPAPIPALTAVVGGLAAIVLVRTSGFRGLLVGSGAGLFVGVLYHFFSHASEGRMDEPAEGIVWHLLSDAVEAAVVAVVILGLCLWLSRRLAGFRPRQHWPS